MNLIPTDWQEEAARQSNDGGSSQGLRLHGAGIT